MKKKLNDAKLNPGFNSSGNLGCGVDRQLIQRVEQASPNNMPTCTVLASSRTFDLDPRLVLDTRLLFETQLLLKHCQSGIPG